MLTMPFPNTRAVPPDLADYFAGTVTGGMTATVDIRHPDGPQVRDPAAGRTGFTASVPFYTGCARVQGSGTGPSSETPAGRQLATGSYLIAVPHTVDQARIGDLVRVHAGADDPAANGLDLVVVDIPKASIILQRNLRCELPEKTQKGST